MDNSYNVCHHLGVLANLDPPWQQRNASHQVSMGFQACYLFIDFFLQKCTDFKKCLNVVAIAILAIFELLW